MTAYFDFFSTVTPNDTLITANKRLARLLQEQYRLFQTQQGIAGWKTLDILPLQTWYEHVWEQAQWQGIIAPKMLLNPLQTQTLWKAIIGEEHPLFHLPTTTTLAHHAWELAQGWTLNIQDPLFAATEDTRIWQSWALAFQERCRQEAWIDPASLAQQVISLIETRFLSPSPHRHRVHFIGFDQFPPQTQHLITVLKSQHWTCEIVHLAIQAQHHVAIAYSNAQEELRHLTTWVYHQHQQNPTASIGVIISDLHTRRAEILTAFSQIFTPQRQNLQDLARRASGEPSEHTQSYVLPSPALRAPSPLWGEGNNARDMEGAASDAQQRQSLKGEGYTTPFNISGADPLKHFPLIQSALHLLAAGQQSRKTYSIDFLSRLLRSPFLKGSETEHLSRAQLDAILRRRWRTGIDGSELIALSEQHACPQWGKIVKTIQQNTPPLHQKHTLSTWMSFFKTQLEQVGWPGERPLNSTEYQLYERWQELLQDCASLEIVCPQDYSETEALKQLEQWADKTVFQPENSDAPIQVLGILEAGGFIFDKVWITGLHAGLWPRPTAPHPFLPRVLQQTLGMPHASPLKELEYCQHLTQRFLRSAPEIILSYPTYEEDRPLRISPVIPKNIPIGAPSDLDLPTVSTHAEAMYQSRLLEILEDAQGTALQASEALHGGSTILKDQAACPFRAFARHRLGARALEAPTSGLSALDRGHLLHLALDVLWRMLQAHPSIHTGGKAETMYQHPIETAVEEALTTWMKKNPRALSPNFKILETIRLKERLRALLRYEEQRPPFQVFATEVKHSIDFGEWSLNLRLDRVDVLETGDHLLIDYKTRSTSILEWLGDRPDDPQLPLYALAMPTPPAGIAFVELRAQGISFKGLASQDIGIEGIHSSEEWEHLLHEWRSVLYQLAEQFRSGDARVDPKRGQHTCRQCDLQVLCREHTTKRMSYDASIR